MKKIIELNNTLIIGISLIVLSFFSMLNFIVTTIVYETSRDFPYILCIALLNLSYLLIGVSFICFEKIKLPLIPIALFLFSVISLYSIKDMFLAIPIYLILAVISLMNYKYAKVGLGIIAFLLCINIFDIFLGSVIDYVRLMDNPQNYTAHIDFTISGWILLVVQFSLFLLFLSKVEKKPKKQVLSKENTIELNPSVIDFKTLLAFIEQQHKDGVISDDEYNMKRAEILKQL